MRLGPGKCAPPRQPWIRLSPFPKVVICGTYLRVWTGRQAESDPSIPDQRRQIEPYCAGRGWVIVEDYVEPGSSATDDRRPAFQEMIDAALAKPPAFGTILVHSFSRFFRASSNSSSMPASSRRTVCRSSPSLKTWATIRWAR
ncbi:MAG: recombinase family protein [Xanthobacteraceae bacterium]